VDDPALMGSGTSSNSHNYAYTDRGLADGVYEYRLIDIALNGTRTAHDPKRVETRTIAPTSWSLGTVHPNPATSRITLPLALPMNAIIDAAMYDVTGREIAHPVSSEWMPAGEQSIAIDLNSIGLPTGSYALGITARDASTGAIVWQSPRASMIEVLR
jgi:hypothetical protein